MAKVTGGWYVVVVRLFGVWLGTGVFPEPGCPNHHITPCSAVVKQANGQTKSHWKWLGSIPGSLISLGNFS